MEVNLDSYDYIIALCSGGKDSIACILDLIDRGVDLSRVELWHHSIDGKEGGRMKFDWPCTEAYCEAFANHIGVDLWYSWKSYGFEGEMLRDNARTKTTKFQVPLPDGSVEVREVGGTRGKESTRLKFPQVSADLTVRWCSAYLKVDPGRVAIRHQERFVNKRTLLVSGERAEESPGRAKYAEFEPDDTNLTGGKIERHVDRWRPVHKWSEQDVWDIMRRHLIFPHPCYRLGWSRCSCSACIFNQENEFASFRQLFPGMFDIISGYEEQFGRTVKRNMSLPVLADKGTPFKMDAEDIRLAMSTEWDRSMLLDPWELPQGAFKGGCGPT